MSTETAPAARSRSSLPDTVLSLLRRGDSIALLLARLTVGEVFVLSGWGKIHNLEKVTGYFTELMIPMPALNARVASLTELVGGALVFVGLGSRLASLPLAFTMVIALLTAKRAEIHGIDDLFGQVEWTYIALLLVIATVGPGKIALDTFVAKAWAERKRA